MLNPCKLCGTAARQINIDPDTSMHRGWSVVECSNTKCGSRIEVQSSKMPAPEWHKDQTGWDIIGGQFTQACAEAVRRWNILNEPSPVIVKELAPKSRGGYIDLRKFGFRGGVSKEARREIEENETRRLSRIQRGAMTIFR